MKRYSIAAAAALVMACNVVQGGVIVNETFATNGPISGYTGAGQTFDASTATGNALGTVTGGQLSFGLSGSTATGTDAMLAHIAFPVTETMVSMQMNVTGVVYNATSSPPGGLLLSVGNFPTLASYNPGWNVYPGRNFGAMNITAASASGVALWENVTNATTSMTLNQTNTWTLFFNNSGSTQSFTAPDGSTQTLNDASYTGYIGTTLLAANVAKGSSIAASSNTLTGIVFAAGRNYSGGASDTLLGNLIVRDDLNIDAVPEPASLGLLALGGFAMLGRRRQR